MVRRQWSLTDLRRIRLRVWNYWIHVRSPLLKQCDPTPTSYLSSYKVSTIHMLHHYVLLRAASGGNVYPSVGTENILYMHSTHLVIYFL